MKAMAKGFFQSGRFGVGGGAAGVMAAAPLTSIGLRAPGCMALSQTGFTGACDRAAGRREAASPAAASRRERGALLPRGPGARRRGLVSAAGRGGARRPTHTATPVIGTSGSADRTPVITRYAHWFSGAAWPHTAQAEAAREAKSAARPASGARRARIRSTPAR